MKTIPSIREETPELIPSPANVSGVPSTRSSAEPCLDEASVRQFNRWFVEHKSLRASAGSLGGREMLCGTMKSTPLVKHISGTIISVNQLCICGAVADMCDELACRISDCSERTGELVAQDNPETTVIPTELMTANKSLRTDENVQGNLLHNNEKNWKSSLSSSIDQAML